MSSTLRIPRHALVTLALIATLFVGATAATGGKLIPSAHAAPAPKAGVSPNSWIPCANTVWHDVGGGWTEGTDGSSANLYSENLVDATDNTYFCNKTRVEFDLSPPIGRCSNYSLSAQPGNWTAGGTTCVNETIWSPAVYTADGANADGYLAYIGNAPACGVYWTTP